MSAEFPVGRFELDPRDKVTLMTLLGCFGNDNSGILCSNLQFQCFAMIGQYFSELEQLSLIPSDLDSFADFQWFQPKPEDSVKVAEHSFGSLSQMKLTPSGTQNSFSEPNGESGPVRSVRLTSGQLSMPGTVSFTFEIDLDQNAQKSEKKTEFMSISDGASVDLLEIAFDQSRHSIKLSMGLSRDPSDSEEGLQLRLELKSDSVQFAKPNSIFLPIKENFAQKTSHNQKFILLFKKRNKRDTEILLLRMNTSSVSGENLISSNLVVSAPKAELDFSDFRVSLMSFWDQEAFKLRVVRLMLSDSAGSLWMTRISSPLSRVSDECRVSCLVGRLPLDKQELKSAMMSRETPFANQSKICWLCPADSVFQVATGMCSEYCKRNTFNRNGNCEDCALEDCAEQPSKLTYQLELGDTETPDQLRLTPSISHLVFDRKMYENNFEIYRSFEGQPFEKQTFKVEVEEDSQTGIFTLSDLATRAQVVTKQASNTLSSDTSSKKAQRFVKYRVQLRPSAQVKDINRNLVSSAPLYIEAPLAESSIDPLSGARENPIRVPGSVSTLHSDLFIHPRYSSCFSTFSDAGARVFAIVLYALYLAIILIFVGFCLLCWGKLSPFRFSTGATHLFVSCACVFLSIVFCVFYEFDSPPTLDLFLRHLFHISVSWHGIFRQPAFQNHQNNSQFLYNFFRVITKKSFELSIVQSVFLNFGIILLILFLLWIIGAGIYFTVLKPKTKAKNPKINSQKVTKPQKIDSIQIKNTGEVLHSPTDSAPASFSRRVFLALAFLLPTSITLSLSVELMFFISFEFHRAHPVHPLFIASLVVSVCLLLAFAILLCWLLYFPFSYFSRFNRLHLPLPLKTDPQFQSKLKARADAVKALNQGHSDLTFLNFTDQRSQFSPFAWLFVLQGLKFRFPGPHFLGLTASLFSLYGIFAAVLPDSSAIIANFVVVSALFLLALSFPLVSTLENVFLVLGYLIFWVGHLLLLILALTRFSAATNCRLGQAIWALFAIGWFVLALGLLYSMLRFCLYLKKKSAGYSGQMAHAVGIPQSGPNKPKADQMVSIPRSFSLGKQSQQRLIQARSRAKLVDVHKNAVSANANLKPKLKHKTFSEDFDGNLINVNHQEQFLKSEKRKKKKLIIKNYQKRIDQTTERNTRTLQPDEDSGEDWNGPVSPFGEEGTSEEMELAFKPIESKHSRHARDDERSKSRSRKYRHDTPQPKFELEYQPKNIGQSHLEVTRRKSRNRFHQRHSKSQQRRMKSGRQMAVRPEEGGDSSRLPEEDIQANFYVARVKTRINSSDYDRLSRTYNFNSGDSKMLNFRTRTGRQVNLSGLTTSPERKIVYRNRQNENVFFTKDSGKLEKNKGEMDAIRPDYHHHHGQHLVISQEYK